MLRSHIRPLYQKISDFVDQDQQYIFWFRSSLDLLVRNKIWVCSVILTLVSYITIRLYQTGSLAVLPIFGVNIALLIVPLSSKKMNSIFPISFYSMQRFWILALLMFDILYFRNHIKIEMIEPTLIIMIIWTTSISHSWSRAVGRNLFETSSFAIVYSFIHRWDVFDIFLSFIVVLISITISLLLNFCVKVLYYFFKQPGMLDPSDDESSHKLASLIRSLAHSLSGFTMTIDLISFRNLNSPHLSKQSREEWSDIQASIQELNSVVRDIRTIQKTTSGEESILLDGVKIDAIYQDLYSHFDDITREKNIDFSSNIDTRSSACIWANKEILFRNIGITLVSKLVERSEEWGTIVMNAYTAPKETLICFANEKSLPSEPELRKYLDTDIKKPEMNNPGGILYLSIVDFFAKQLGAEFFTLMSSDNDKKIAYVLIFKNTGSITLKELNYLIAS